MGAMGSMGPMAQGLRAAQAGLATEICTPNGIVPLNPTAPNNGQTEHDMAACQFCQVRLVGDDAVLPVASVGHVAKAANFAWPYRPTTTPHRASGGALPARGPPFIV